MNDSGVRVHLAATPSTRRPLGRRALGASLSMLLPALCILLCLLGAAAADAAPAARAGLAARPGTQAPMGTITALRPTVSWTTGGGALRYDLRIYEGRRWSNSL
ncbi:MAG: hypothetical protein WCN81_15620, partial [Actinomycetes bacterium]